MYVCEWVAICTYTCIWYMCDVLLQKDRDTTTGQRWQTSFCASECTKVPPIFSHSWTSCHRFREWPQYFVDLQWPDPKQFQIQLEFDTTQTGWPMWGWWSLGRSPGNRSILRTKVSNCKLLTGRLCETAFCSFIRMEFLVNVHIWTNQLTKIQNVLMCGSNCPANTWKTKSSKLCWMPSAWISKA